MTVFRCCCPYCPNYPANVIQMGWATWAIWAAINKYSQCSQLQNKYLILLIPGVSCSHEYIPVQMYKVASQKYSEFNMVSSNSFMVAVFLQQLVHCV